MKYYVFLVLSLVLANTFAGENYQDLTDNEFAEFDDFESEEDLVINNQQDIKESSQVNNEFVADDDEQDMVINNSNFQAAQNLYMRCAKMINIVATKPQTVLKFIFTII